MKLGFIRFRNSSPLLKVLPLGILWGLFINNEMNIWELWNFPSPLSLDFSAKSPINFRPSLLYKSGTWFLEYPIMLKHPKAIKIIRIYFQKYKKGKGIIKLRFIFKLTNNFIFLRNLIFWCDINFVIILTIIHYDIILFYSCFILDAKFPLVNSLLIVCTLGKWRVFWKLSVLEKNTGRIQIKMVGHFEFSTVFRFWGVGNSH